MLIFFNEKYTIFIKTINYISVGIYHRRRAGGLDCLPASSPVSSGVRRLSRCLKTYLTNIILVKSQAQRNLCWWLDDSIIESFKADEANLSQRSAEQWPSGRRRGGVPGKCLQGAQEVLVVLCVAGAGTGSPSVTHSPVHAWLTHFSVWMFSFKKLCRLSKCRGN